MSGCGGAAWLGACTRGSAVLRPAARLFWACVSACAALQGTSWLWGRCLCRAGRACQARPKHEVLVVASGGLQRDGAVLCVWGVLLRGGHSSSAKMVCKHLLLV